MRLWTLIIIAALLGMGAYAYTIDESIAIETLTKQGFTEVEVTRKVAMVAGFFGCGEDDLVAFRANATNVNDERVNDIIVCVGFFKGTTIRY